MVPTRTIFWIAAIWVVVLGTYALAPLVLHDKQSLRSFGDVAQCIVPLLANAGLLMNAGTPHWRRNVFWMLFAMGCTLWMIGQFQWTYYEVYLHQELPDLYPGDVTFFLRGVPMMAALALRPHLTRSELRLRFGYLDFVLLLTWWLFLYVYAVMPWLYASPSVEQYNFGYEIVTNIQNAVIVVGLAFLWLRTSWAWRLVYAGLFGGAALQMTASLLINVGISLKTYETGKWFDLPMLAAFLWYGTAGYFAHTMRNALDAPAEGSDAETNTQQNQTTWATKLAMAAVLSLPVFAFYTLRSSPETWAVRDFRLYATVIASVPLVFLVFLRQHLADKERLRLLAHSEQSIENLQRLQTQLVQSEKLISLGQLAAGAAHEINNPLTAILGYSDLLADDQTIPEKSRGVAAKIRDQARRTKTLVQNLLSFARQVPAERTLLDLNTVVTNAVQLRALDLRGGTTKVDLQLESVLPGVRGDGNQLLQVFFNIINNAVDAMESAHGGGTLTVKTARDRAWVVVLFSDTGPGIREPHRVFDPFYTTKPVGKGTGLGLSICFGIVQEHAGRILCYNRQEGGAVFRVELPAVLASLASREPHLTGAGTPQKPA
jgi:signal transduction histidine kinase